VSTRWAQQTARRYQCHVTVGYPETTAATPAKRYNSTVTVSPEGKVVANYRKHFLYYTDETWASEGDVSFFSGVLGTLGQVSHGICMDINPYKFTAEWSEYEFASAALRARSPLIALSNAWITRLTPDELAAEPLEPDVETQTYWLERMRPIITSAPSEPIVVVFANRAGQEGGVCYAGSSMVVRVGPDGVSIHDRLGRKEERCMILDLNEVGGTLHSLSLPSAPTPLPLLQPQDRIAT
jgi:protein N-terminal amidase